MADGFTIKVEGLRELQAALRKIQGIDGELAEAHRRASMLAAKAAGRQAPVGETGRLFSSIRARPTKTMGRITLGSQGVPYAGPIHFGWAKRNIKPNKFAYRGIAIEQRDILREYINDTNRILKRAGLTPD